MTRSFTKPSTPIPHRIDGFTQIMKIPIPDFISTLKPYTPGKPIEELEREYGVRNPIKLASNENPLGASPRAVAAATAAVSTIYRYPDGAGHDLRVKLSAHLDVPASAILLGNGSDEIISLLAQLLLRPGDEAIIPSPSFLMYEIVVRAAGGETAFVPLDGFAIDLDAVKARITDRTRLIFLCNPNNPTGATFSADRLDAFLADIPDNIVVVVDEAYIEFVREADCPRTTGRYLDTHPVVTLRTFSKAYGLAGLRIGYAVGPPSLITDVNRIRMPFNTSLLGQVAATAALDDAEFLERSIRLVHEGLDYLYEALGAMGLDLFPTQANFFLFDVKRSADAVYEALLRRGVIVRSMSAYGYPTYIRLSVGLAAENRRFIEALGEALEERHGTVRS